MEGWQVPPALLASGVRGPSLSKRKENPARKRNEPEREWMAHAVWYVAFKSSRSFGHRTRENMSSLVSLLFVSYVNKACVNQTIEDVSSSLQPTLYNSQSRTPQVMAKATSLRVVYSGTLDRKMSRKGGENVSGERERIFIAFFRYQLIN
jgi:hypothetical protein